MRPGKAELEKLVLPEPMTNWVEFAVRALLLNVIFLTKVPLMNIEKTLLPTVSTRLYHVLRVGTKLVMMSEFVPVVNITRARRVLLTPESKHAPNSKC